MSEQAIKQITIGEQGWRSGGSARETPPTSMARSRMWVEFVGKSPVCS